MEIQYFAVWAQESETSFISHVPYGPCSVMCHPSGPVALVTLWHDSLAHKNNVFIGTFRASHVFYDVAKETSLFLA